MEQRGSVSLSQTKPTPSEIRMLEEALSADLKSCSIRLREGEHQHSLAKAIALSQLEMHFPDTRGIIRGLYGEEKTSDIQLVRKIQTILKKMEKGNIVQILPKKRPWDLQRYGIVSFKFEDVDKNHVTLATDEQIEQAQSVLRSLLTDQATVAARISRNRIATGLLALVLVVSYATCVFALLQPIVDAIVFISSFSIASALALALGKRLAREW
jgi:hypothetical protein